MTLDDLLAREGIRDLVARYNAYGDSGRFEQLWELFAPDAAMEIRLLEGEPATYEGLENLKGIFTGARDRLREQASSPMPPPVRHFTTTHQIDLVDPDHATGRCYFAVILGSGLDHWGRYVDDYVRLDDRWRFQRRRVHLDGQVH